MKNNKKPVIAYLHTHWDPEWYRTSDSFNVRLVKITDEILNLLSSGKIPFFYFDGQVYALLNYLKFRPEKEKVIKKLIKEKKLFIGPFFASVDSFLISGASLVKNLEIGLKISKKFKEDNFIGYLSDTFGHSKSIFEVLKHFKIQNAIIWRGVSVLHSDFIANGIKTTRLVWGYYHDVFHSNLSIEKKAEIIEKTLDKINEKSGNILLLPIGGDHLGVIENVFEQIEKINLKLKNYEIILSNPFEYLNCADFSKENYEGEFLDNSETYILSGVYSARTPEKAENSRLEWNLFNRAQVFDYFMKGKYERELEAATIELIKNHAHDSIYGCSLDFVHSQVRQRQNSVNELTKTVLGYLIKDFKKENLFVENNDYIGVFNFSNHVQSGALKVVTDKKLKNAQKIGEFFGVSDEISYNLNQNPMTEDFHKFYEYLIEVDPISPFSFKNFKLKPIKKEVVVGCDFIENKFLKLYVLNSKIYLFDKKTNTLYSDFIELLSTPDGGDSYNFAPLDYPKTLKIKSSKVKMNGKIKSSLEIKFEENIKLIFSLTNKSEFFEIEADFVNKKKNRKLQVSFNTKSLIYKTLAKNPIGTIEREHDPDYLLFENMPPKKREELKTNSYPMQKYVLANGVGIITEGLNEYEIYKNSIRICLLRSVGIISNPKNSARKVPAGPPIECPHMQCLGHNHFRFALAFNENLEGVSQNFCNPFLGILGEFKAKNKTFISNKKGKEFIGISDKKPLFF